MKNNATLLFLFLGISIGAVLYWLNGDTPLEEPDEPKTELALSSNPQNDNHSYFFQKFGLPNSNSSIYEGKIGSNEFLSDILLSCNVSMAKIDQLAKKSVGSYDVKKLQAGKKYYVVSDEETQKGTHFIYVENLVRSLVYHLSDSIQIDEILQPVETRLKTTAGEIQNSLYLTLQENNSNPFLAVELSEVMAWSVDFYHIFKGDKFKVVYEENFVDNQSVGIGNIEAAYFEHTGGDHYAIAFKQDSTISYFDDECNSVRKAFLKAPLRFSRISSRFSRKRFHPVLKRYKGHFGTDYAAPRGTPIRTVGDGVVIKKGYTRGNGNYVKIKHNGTYSTQYLHMSKFAKGMKNGKSVKQGDVIGYVGSTGLATGPHLCFRFWKNGKQVDPFRQKLPPAEPIKAEYADAYEVYKDSILNVLKEIPYPIIPNKEDQSTNTAVLANPEP